MNKMPHDDGIPPPPMPPLPQSKKPKPLPVPVPRARIEPPRDIYDISPPSPRKPSAADDIPPPSTPRKSSIADDIPPPCDIYDIPPPSPLLAPQKNIGADDIPPPPLPTPEGGSEDSQQSAPASRQRSASRRSRRMSSKLKVTPAADAVLVPPSSQTAPQQQQQQQAGTVGFRKSRRLVVTTSYREISQPGEEGEASVGTLRSSSSGSSNSYSNMAAESNSWLSHTVLEQMHALERRRRDFMQCLDGAFARYYGAMEKAHQELVVQMERAALATGFDEEQCAGMVKAETTGFEAVAKAQLLRECAPGVKFLDEEIAASSQAFALLQSVLLIQRAYRWHQCRQELKSRSHATYMRERAAREIVESEEAYVQNLKMLMDEYYTPLKSLAAQGKLVTQQQFNDLFLNLKDIYGFNKRMLEAFKVRMAHFDNRTTRIGDIFLKFTQLLQLYRVYVSSFNHSVAVLNQLMESPDFFQWQNAIALQPHMHRMRLNTLLIMPVQRVPRYSLLLRELIAKTPSTHPDLPSLHKAADFVNGAAQSINKAMRAAEAHEKVCELQEFFKEQLPNLARPYRNMIYEGLGAVDTGSGSGPKSCFMRLITDQIIVTKNKSQHKVLWCVILLNAEVMPLAESRSSKWQFGFRVRTQRSKLDFFVDFDNERAKWIRLIGSCIKELPAVLKPYPRDREFLLALTSVKPSTPPPSAAAAASASPSSSSKKPAPQQQPKPPTGGK